jgi:PTS system nitrogen regulatory IIA component
MKLTDILVRDACLVDVRGKTKPEVLRELSEALVACTPGLDRAELYAMLVEREKLGSTAMGDGIAIPHARIESLDRVLAVFGLSRGGVDFDSLDGQPTHLFFLLVAPGREGSAHLLLLARLSRLLGIDAFRARLREVGTTDELFRAIEEEESRH